ncbi:Unknown protein sequence [Pseudomonas amygdali pv. lachrymans]|uniref:Uncharacterized protein n=1 Tax=Pseudomonas amygdali pv. lachrymans TaxID=53707 RepID=A0ABR5KZA1_PSEAV|nr:Unknown protein sequence [Pseudomonas amygdali pv. lachrymans]RMT03130.1 hypothetical protein ALP54_02320 [Pseudomonas amygdali pv. lachrymans]
MDSISVQRPDVLGIAYEKIPSNLSILQVNPSKSAEPTVQQYRI